MSLISSDIAKKCITFRLIPCRKRLFRRLARQRAKGVPTAGRSAVGSPKRAVYARGQSKQWSSSRSDTIPISDLCSIVHLFFRQQSKPHHPIPPSPIRDETRIDRPLHLRLPCIYMVTFCRSPQRMQQRPAVFCFSQQIQYEIGAGEARYVSKVSGFRVRHRVLSVITSSLLGLSCSLWAFKTARPSLVFRSSFRVIQNSPGKVFIYMNSHQIVIAFR